MRARTQITTSTWYGILIIFSQDEFSYLKLEKNIFSEPKTTKIKNKI